LSYQSANAALSFINNIGQHTSNGSSIGLKSHHISQDGNVSCFEKAADANAYVERSDPDHIFRFHFGSMRPAMFIDDGDKYDAKVPGRLYVRVKN
jgi:hypothetical protein